MASGDDKTKQDHEATHPGETVSWAVTYEDDPDPGPGADPCHWERHKCSVCGSSINYCRPGAAP
jgi:hypothetical protein